MLTCLTINSLCLTNNDPRLAMKRNLFRFRSRNSFEDEYESLKIKNRIAMINTWLKVAVIVAFSLFAVFKLWNTDLSSIISNFSFSEFMALILALFSISLSVLFYFKATETSNVFYDNTYRFTQDISEILGRIESGFGERLKHLNEGYLDIKRVVESFPMDPKEVEKRLITDESRKKEIEDERTVVLEEILEIVKQVDKGNELVDEIRNKDNQINELNEKISSLQSQMKEVDFAVDQLIGQIPDPLYKTLMRLSNSILKAEGNQNLSNEEFIETYKRLTTNWPNEVIENMMEYRILDRHFNFTDIGIELLNRWYSANESRKRFFSKYKEQ